MPLTPLTCDKCKCYDGRHHPLCEDIDLEEAKRLLKDYFKLYTDKYVSVYRSANRSVKISNQSRDKFKIEMQRWKAKFEEVKHENNMLRKKLRRNETNTLAKGNNCVTCSCGRFDTCAMA